ncbi:glycoside hydrolase family 61 protein [Dothistroma septosporum NZE10]|uniref:Glycoside hydrolase family 61 protein n=1 Tax=Dothistroma septosporum (strain NZE10 / CBS 128990) TaxID=675120 RepID=N1PX89_DOTSN|nr:glycoside hydrolase family 61 protein [Dothistroma septosporum NZE10]
MSILCTAAGLVFLAASVSAHGYVEGIVADGTFYQGYNPSFQYQQTAPSVAGWSDPENLANGYIAPSAFADPDIVCHLGATPGTAAATVAAGGKVELQWNTWPESHHGPVLAYLAPVPAEDWSDVNKSALSFVKISEGGLVDGSSSPGTWASDQLIANNNSWVVTIPDSIAPGKYVLRHEIIALHSAGQDDGAQAYPQCVNLEVTGSGTASPEGEAATSFYKKDDAGILVNIYTSGYSYIIPGPTLWSGAGTAARQTEVAASGSAAASNVAATPSAALTSAQAVTSAGARTSAAVQENQETKTQKTSEPVSYSSIASSSTTEADVGATTVKSSCTTTLYVSATAAVTVTGPALYSAIATLTSAIPSEAFTSTLPAYSAATAPTGSYAGNTNDTLRWGDLPTKPLPEGWTLKDLLQWVTYLLKQSWTRKDQRNHARDFEEAEDVGPF